MKFIKKCKECNIEFNSNHHSICFCQESCKKINNIRSGKLWRSNNKISLVKNKKKWHEDFKEQHGISLSTFKRNNDINERIKHNIRVRINKAIKNINKSGSAVNELGCSLEDFRNYTSSLFKPGMSWGNYGEWHIDHIKPLDSFDLSNLDEFKKACNYKNLQPLWAKDNLKKSNKF